MDTKYLPKKIAQNIGFSTYFKLQAIPFKKALRNTLCQQEHLEMLNDLAKTFLEA